MTLSDDLLLAALALLPLAGAAFALVVPAADRLTLRAVGVLFSTLALVCGVWLLWRGGASLRVGPLVFRFAGAGLPAALTILGVTPMALRAGAPRVEKGLPAYVVAALVAEAAAVCAVLVDDAVAAVAAATVAAVPFFALVALFGGGERGSTTWRAASLWLLVDGAALGALAVAAHVGADASGMGRASVVVAALLGPGLVRLAAGPWGLWALPVLEQAPVAAACLTGGMVAPVGIVLLGRALGVVDGLPALQAAFAAGLPWLAAALAVACAIGAALVAAERDLRRIVTHLLGALGSVAALVAVADRVLPAVALVGLTGFSASLCLMLVEAVERRLETRKTTELQGLLATAPSLGVLLPCSFLALCGLPGPGVAAALWPALAGLAGRSGPAWESGGLAAFVCGGSLLVAAVGAAGLLPRVAGPPRKALAQHVRVSLRQGIRLLLPVAALVAASLAVDRVVAAAGGAP